MSWGYSWRPYVSVAQRRANAIREASKLAKKGQTLIPIKIEGRKITSTFWGNAWSDNLHAYSDFANRLPRGRTYVRNGSVIDLQIGSGEITALVSGSEIYKVQIKIKPLAKSLWSQVQTLCAGKIDSFIELLQGRLSDKVMEIVTHPENGLFPKPAEISLKCSCPDWAEMCKHVAAVLYGVGARLDQRPDLLFLLRDVNAEELITQAAAAEAIQQAVGGQGPAEIAESELADVFGIEIEANSTMRPPAEKSSGIPKMTPPSHEPKAKPRPARKKSARPSAKRALKRRVDPPSNSRPPASPVVCRQPLATGDSTNP
jgi:uncharacterized Zn finger protein